ncbi:hypothetical protein A3A63_03710 [Candidatus Gottesmanbacteria bacterium RIFCSPLOWO2_01_FULL_46_9]|uniref:Uncharacterized protein n=1 Tax=Candidatus Gottesmanbacteria bacterium RIFCSPLOWO2_01_FULL_46_9 TaxID=1798394 RepID=A0A1F6AX56_9BACT|nr:MAG: hypothetical protein A3A63_03710 [Candidatus Gottesmanbacteria bacterium RIFCSPLOWO2_01_FULL_46_9]
MSSTFFWVAFLFYHGFIQLLWTATSRGRNYQAFIKTWTNIRSVPIVVFEIIAFLQMLLLHALSFPYSLSLQQ